MWGSRRGKIAAAMLLTLAAVAAPVMAQTPPVQPYGANDGGATVLNILPPGQGRYLNSAEALQAQTTGEQPPHNTDQIEMYERMVQGAPDITLDGLTEYFKDATFGVPPTDEDMDEYSPREGVTVLRDSAFGVPHVYGTTRSDVMFGAGYVSGEDRLFMMDTLRHVGRGRLSEFLGATEANLASDRAVYLTSGYTEEELQAMLDRTEGLHPVLGPIAKQDLLDYVDGVNQFIDEATADPTLLPAEYPALQITPEPWTPTDTVAVASLIGSQLGVGGGNELANANFVKVLEGQGFAPKQARKILADFRFANDPEAPVTTRERFNWDANLGKVNKRSVAFPDDPGALTPAARAAELPRKIDGPFGPIPLRFPEGQSNALLVGSELSETGRPLAVMGPQVAYWSPEILMELDLHGPGIDARGVGFPGISQYVLLGRGTDYAWSATSAGGDQVDIFAEKLCNPEGEEVAEDSVFYMKGGKCVEMYTRTDSWEAKPSAGGFPPETVTVEMTTQRTNDGIVQARGMIDGKPVAFVAKRSSFMKEVDSALTYVEILDANRIDGAEDFQRAFGRFGFTFNWFYIDPEDIAYQLGGYHPRRARHTDPDLPVWGTGKWRWRGLLSAAKTPNDISPRKGFITSWNNKQAPGFRSNDGQYSFGPVHRVDPLDAGIRRFKRAGDKMTIADLVNVMGDAATVDLRGTEVLPFMLEAMGRPKDERLTAAIDLLEEWIESGAHRRDKDGDGAYDHASAVALMDAWWNPALEAIFKPVLGNAYDALPFNDHDAPRAQGSAFQNGLYGHVQKDLRTVLGKRVRGKFSRGYCGKGKLAACRTSLLSSFDVAVRGLEEEFGADPATWDADEEGDSIQYTAVGLQGQEPMPWQNRPTFQQVLEFDRVPDPEPAPEPTPTGDPSASPEPEPSPSGEGSPSPSPSGR
ncbi:MAG: penicillin acylase family protein [Actinomycetota bacterium]